MRKAMLGCLIMLTALGVFAQGIGLKPGLWESHIVKQIRDGKDVTAQVTGSMAQMQDKLASMPPEQRAKIEAMMKQNGAPTMGGNGAYKMCVTPEMARQNKPPIDREGCQPTTVQRSGNHSSFDFNCTRGDLTTSGKGEATTTGDTISTVIDTNIQMGNGTPHVMHTEAEMKFLGADCGDVKPPQPPAPKALP